MISVGIDLGSVATKIVLADQGRVLARLSQPSGPQPKATAERVLDLALREKELSRNDVSSTVSTGYSRRQVDFCDRVVTEIAACAKGAVNLPDTERPGLIIDLGGQDTKAILLDDSERVEDFVMNDKCAAGTGRFLELIAHALHLQWEKLPELDRQATSPVKISNTCTVFAESEVVSLVAHGEKVENIVAGIHKSIAERIASMLGRMPLRKPILFCGGGATNEGVRRALEERLQVDVTVPEHPQFVNAFGAALMAANT